MASPYYDKVLGIIQKYLSTGAKDFLNRQVEIHLKKSIDDISQSDKEELSHWCRISGALLLGNEKAEAMCDEIKKV